MQGASGLEACRYPSRERGGDLTSTENVLTLLAPISSRETRVRHLVDPFGRRVDYLRVSVTDRCDLRCLYCMPAHQKFLPKAEILTLEQLDTLCSAFVGLGVRKLRLTGGEPLLRRGFMDLVRALSRHLESGALEELTLTTNGTRLADHAEALAAAGVRRINVSLDSLDPATFARLTRGGDLNRVLGGIDAAQAAGMKVKINIVALAGENEQELSHLIAWAHDRGMDASLIETMPLGEIEQDRTDQYMPLTRVRAALAEIWTLEPLATRSCGPARYVRVAETGGKLGFITPLTHNFCASCNRVRLTATGILYMCLGQDDHADLRTPLREGASPAELEELILAAIARKPEKHDFRIEERGAHPALKRPMSRTGG
jgi:cyclic pyranopterin phosphate synthase